MPKKVIRGFFLICVVILAILAFLTRNNPPDNHPNPPTVTSVLSTTPASITDILVSVVIVLLIFSVVFWLLKRVWRAIKKANDHTNPRQVPTNDNTANNTTQTPAEANTSRGERLAPIYGLIFVALVIGAIVWCWQVYLETSPAKLDDGDLIVSSSPDGEVRQFSVSNDKKSGSQRIIAPPLDESPVSFVMPTNCDWVIEPEWKKTEEVKILVRNASGATWEITPHKPQSAPPSSNRLADRTYYFHSGGNKPVGVVIRWERW